MRDHYDKERHFLSIVLKRRPENFALFQNTHCHPRVLSPESSLRRLSSRSFIPIILISHERQQSRRKPSSTGSRRNEISREEGIEKKTLPSCALIIIPWFFPPFSPHLLFHRVSSFPSSASRVSNSPTRHQIPSPSHRPSFILCLSPVDRLLSNSCSSSMTAASSKFCPPSLDSDYYFVPGCWKKVSHWSHCVCFVCLTSAECIR